MAYLDHQRYGSINGDAIEGLGEDVFNREKIVYFTQEKCGLLLNYGLSGQYRYTDVLGLPHDS